MMAASDASVSEPSEGVEASRGGSTPTRRALIAGVGALAVGAVAAPAAAAPSSGGAKGAAARRKAKRHRAVCRHAHRCAKHRKHTCRRKHACPHRFHKAPKKKPGKNTSSGGPAPAAVPTLSTVLMTRRFSYGASAFPAASGGTMTGAITAAGGARAWFEKQLKPASVPDPIGDEINTWWPSLTLPATEIGARNIAEVEAGWVVEANFQRWTLARRIHSTRQVHELMSEFWENLLHVTVGADGVFPHRADYSRTIRTHALGRFSDLLHAAITHPAMGVYLNNGSSTKRAPNENLGRELLEVHTVGEGIYSEQDVKNSARILTGWRAASWIPWTHQYDPNSHWTGAVRVLDFTHANTDPDGRALTRAYLDYLARHPATAHRIARRLAIRFVGENPSAAYVRRIAEVYDRSGTAIAPVLRFIVDSPEYAASAGATITRTPTDDMVATYRAIGAVLQRPTRDASSANQILWIVRSMGQTPFGWPRPDGQPTDGAAWASPSRMLGSCRFHWDFANGWYPKNEAVLKSVADWMPAATLTVDTLSAHVARTVLGREPSASLIAACRTALGLPGQAVLTVSGDKVTTPGRGNIAWELPVVLATVLDSPAHMHR